MRLIFLASLAWAQVRLTLPRALESALEYNLSLQRTKYARELAQFGITTAYMGFLPDLSVNLNLAQNYGTTFDQFAFQRVRRTTTFFTPSANATWVIFRGLAQHYLLKQARWRAAGADATVKRTAIEVLVQVLNQFFLALADKPALEIQKERIQSLQTQLELTQTLAQTGARTETEVLSLQATLSREKANLQALLNRHRENTLLLLQLIGWENVAVDSVTLELGMEAPGLEPLPPWPAIQERALAFAPELEERRINGLIQRYAYKSAQAARFPSLILAGRVGSAYSSNGGQFRLVGTSFVRERTALGQQLPDNLNQSLSLTLNIPIFTRFTALQNVRSAENAIQNAEIEYRIAYQNVLRRAQQAYLQAENAYTLLQTRQESQQAAQLAFERTQAQYQLGRVNYLQYYEALNAYNIAQLEYQQALQEWHLRYLFLQALQGNLPTTLP
ncbi:MAG: TolC family protein [Bacteroidia bacterium]